MRFHCTAYEKCWKIMCSRYNWITFGKRYVYNLSLKNYMQPIANEIPSICGVFSWVKAAIIFLEFDSVAQTFVQNLETMSETVLFL